MPPRAKKARAPSVDDEASDGPASASAGPSSAGIPAPVTPTRASGRPQRRSAAKTVDYSALLAPGDGDGDDDDEDAEVEESSEEESDDSLGSSVHASPPLKGKGRGSGKGTGGRKAARLEAMDLDDDAEDADMTANDDVDSDEESIVRRPTQKGKKKATIVSAKAPASSPAIKSRRGPRPSAAKLTKGHYAHHDLRPLYFPGPSGSGLLQIDEILPLDQIGRRAPRTRQLKTAEAQEERVRRHRVCWSANDHYMRINEETLAGADWAWFPGKDTDLQSERRQRQRVKEYWLKRHAGEEVGEQEVQEIQRIGGTVLLDRAGDMKVLTQQESQAYRPPRVDLSSQLPPPSEPPTSIEDFTERGPSCSSAEGSIKVAMGVKANDSAGVSKQRTFELKSRQAKSLQDCGLSLGPAGCIINAGSFVPSLDWAPRPPHAPAGPEYLAVAVTLTSAPATVPDTPLAALSEAKGAVQLWSIGSSSNSDAEAPSAQQESGSSSVCRLEYQLCIPKGEVRQVKWSPCGADFRDEAGWQTDKSGVPPPRIGLLACVMSTQKVVIFAMPTPEAVRQSCKSKEKQAATVLEPHIELSPILELPIYGRNRQAICLDWAGGERLVAGCSDGTLICWPIGEILRSLTPISRTSPAPMSSLLPSHSLQVHECAILSLSFLQLPPRPARSREDQSAEGEGEKEQYDHDGLPHTILSTALDGSLKIVNLDLVDLVGDLPSRREPGYSTSFLPFLGIWVGERGDNTVRFVNPKPSLYGKSHLVASHDGRCTTVDGSPFHPMIASGGADGAVKITNALKNLVRDPNKYQWPLYRLDLNRFTGEVRYVDNILPSQFIFRAPATSDPVGSTSSAQQTGINTGAWHPSVRVTCVRWNPNVAGPVLLASASAMGLVRVEMVCAYDVAKLEPDGGGGGEEEVRADAMEE